MFSIVFMPGPHCFLFVCMLCHAGTASRKRRASAPEHVLLAGSKVTRLKNNADAPSSALRATRQARSASPAPITNHAAATAADEAGPAAAPAAPAAAAGGRAGTSPRAKRAVVWADNLTPQTSPVHGLTLHTATDTKPHRQPQSAQPTPASTSGTPHTFNLTPGSVMTVNTDMSPLGLGSPIDGTWERRRSSGAASRLGMGAGAGSRQQGPSNPASPAPVQPAAAAAAAPEFALFAGGAAAAAARVCDTPFLAGKRSGAGGAAAGRQRTSATAAAGSTALQPAQSAAQSPAAIPAVRSTAAAVPPLTLHTQSDPGYVDLSLAARLAGAGASGSGGTPADSPSVPLAARLLMKHRRKSSSASLPALKAPTLLITPRPSPLGTPVATPAGTPHAAEDAVAGPGGAAGAAQGAADDAAQMGAQGSLPGSSMQLGVSAASTPAGPNTSAAANAEASPVPTGQSPDVIPCSVITNWGCAGVSPLAPHGADDGDACESNPAAVPAVGRARGAQLPALTPQDPTQPRALRSRASQPTVHTVADSPVFIDLTNTPGYSEHAANADQPPSQSAQGSMGAGTAKQGANAHGLHAAQAGGARRLQGVQQVPMARGGQHADGSKGAKRSPDNKKRGGIWKYLVGSQAGLGGGAGPSKAGAQGPRPAAVAEGGGGSSGGGGDGAPQLQRKSAGGTAGQLCAPRLRGAATGKDAGQ